MSQIVEETARLEVKTQSTATSPMGSSSSLEMPQLLPRSPRHLHQLSSQSTEALLYSGAAALSADNLSFSSFEASLETVHCCYTQACLNYSYVIYI